MAQNQGSIKGDYTVLGMVVNREEEKTVKKRAASYPMSVSDYLRTKEGLPKRGKRRE
jgi:hypothetical protein